MTRRLGVEILLGVMLALFAYSWWSERQVRLSEGQVIARTVTVRDSITLVRTDTLYRTALHSANVSRGTVRTLRDTLHITDTLEVKRFVARVDTTLVRDSVALALADTVIAKHVVLESDLRTELQMALRPKPSPRLVATVTGLYDVINATPLVSVSAGVRVIGSASLVAVAFQRVQLGETPRVFLGVSVRLR